jgi:hypothetical protein
MSRHVHLPGSPSLWNIPDRDHPAGRTLFGGLGFSQSQNSAEEKKRKKAHGRKT